MLNAVNNFTSATASTVDDDDDEEDEDEDEEEEEEEVLEVGAEAVAFFSKAAIFLT